MRLLVLKSWMLLLYFDCVMKLLAFKELYALVRNEPVSSIHSSRPIPAQEICRAVDLACVFYFKRVLCLQRSAATAILLRRHGWSGEMVIGAQIVPFKSHAWCEIDRIVVNDRPYMEEIYQVLERC